MRKQVITGFAAALALAGATACGGGSAQTQGGGPGGGRGGGARPPMPVEFAPVKRATVTEKVTIVGNLIGAATVEAVPKVNGRLQSVNVRLGDAVRQGQQIAKVEDREIREQVRQQEAAFKVAEATIRQREADLKLAQTNLERNRSLLERQLLPRQTYDDSEARYQASLAQLDLARAQFEQSKARLEELRINLSNTVIASPVDGFIGKRYLDPGAAVSPNAPVASVVAIATVRMVANVVEKDVKKLSVGMPAQVEVDAFPGEKFRGKVARVAPVFDPQTRTAEMEIEVPNPTNRLKPGMYARVSLRVADKPNALTVPRNAIVTRGSEQVVYVVDGSVARQRRIEIGIQGPERVEVTSGLREGERIVTTGAAALQDGDRIVMPGDAPPPGAAAGTGRGQ